jgi:hypothetical protein
VLFPEDDFGDTRPSEPITSQRRYTNIVLIIVNALFALTVLTATVGLLGWGIVTPNNHQPETTI